MTVKNTLTKEVATLREKHMALVQKARDKGEYLYGMSTLNTYEILIESYSRIIKDLEDDR